MTMTWRRRLAAGWLVVCLNGGSLLAQQVPNCAAPNMMPACAAPACQTPGCLTSQCNPPCQPPCSPPCAPPTAPQPQMLYAPEETGAYVAPQLAGSARGPTNRVGFESGSITFPELRLRFPQFELPGFFRSRSNSRMMYEGGEAPWQTTGVTNTYAAQNAALLQQQVAGLQQQLATTAPAGGPSQAESLAAKEAAEKFLAANQDELNRLRCEVNRLRALETALRDAQQRAGENKDCANGGFVPPAPQKGQLTPPQPPAAFHPAAPPAFYPTRPAAFIAEGPTPLAGGVIQEPGRSGVIREPRGAIIGLRLPGQ